MNYQEVFNKAYLGLKSQGFQRSMKDGFTGNKCCYRGDCGMKCAIGWLIDDKDYKPIFDAGGYSTSIGDQLDIQTLLGVKTENDLVFLTKLQTAHDRCRSHLNEDVMRSNLISVAEQYKLTVPEDSVPENEWLGNAF